KVLLLAHGALRMYSNMPLDANLILLVPFRRMAMCLHRRGAGVSFLREHACACSRKNDTPHKSSPLPLRFVSAGEGVGGWGPRSQRPMGAPFTLHGASPAAVRPWRN